jgi:predicted metal-dependent hydrolase
MPAQLSLPIMITQGFGQATLTVPAPSARRGQARRVAGGSGAGAHAVVAKGAPYGAIPYRPAAVRIPDALHHQLGFSFSSSAPQIFVHEGSRQILERRLASVLKETVVLSLTDNRRTMISSEVREGFRQVRLHHMFLDADAFTLQALGRFIRRADRASSTIINQFIDANRYKIKPAKPRSLKIRTQGSVHDLQYVYNDINARYFGGTVNASITWGKHTEPTRRRRRSIKLGSYSSDERLIRVHPVLDQSWVPAYFIEYIVFHEMLHHVIPAPVVNGRTLFHTPEFRSQERLFEHYERAIRWEKRNLNKLLSA